MTRLDDDLRAALAREEPVPDGTAAARASRDALRAGRRGATLRRVALAGGGVAFAGFVAAAVLTLPQPDRAGRRVAAAEPCTARLGEIRVGRWSAPSVGGVPVRVALDGIGDGTQPTLHVVDAAAVRVTPPPPRRWVTKLTLAVAPGARGVRLWATRRDGGDAAVFFGGDRRATTRLAVDGLEVTGGQAGAGMAVPRTGCYVFRARWPGGGWAAAVRVLPRP